MKLVKGLNHGKRQALILFIPCLKDIPNLVTFFHELSSRTSESTLCLAVVMNHAVGCNLSFILCFT